MKSKWISFYIKCRSSICLVLLIILAAICLPEFIFSKYGARDYLIEYAKNFNINIKLNNIEWQWWPAPHISISKPVLDMKELNLTAESVVIRPDIINTLNGNPQLGNITLKRPSIKVKSLDLSNTKSETSPIPFNLIIEDGSISTSPGQCIPGFVCRDKTTVFSGIYSTLRFHPAQISGHLSFSPSYAEHIFISGLFSSYKRKFKFKLSVDKGHFETFLREFTDFKKETLTLSDFDMDIKAQGRIDKDFSAEIRAESPCLLFPDKKKAPFISCGAIFVDLKKTDDNLIFNIRELESTDPRLSLNGYVKASSLLSKEAVNWDIDIRGKDIDLKTLRKKIMSFFGSDKSVREICDIVRGGKAAEARYRFKGRTDEIENFESMIITALADKVPVHVPEIDLYLSEASGLIKIEDGVLYGKEMNAKIQTSTASNGSIIVGLDRGKNQLTVDLDLKADLTELHEVLGQIVDDKEFQNELKMIHDIQGKARGHLHIGENSRQFSVNADVHEINGNFFYERLNIPVKFNRGKISLREHSVAWKEVNALAGDSLIKEAKGAVDWKKNIRLDIKDARADINSNQLFQTVMKYPFVSNLLEPLLTDINGTIAVSRFSLKGEIGNEDSFNVEFDTSPEEVRFLSPLLPGMTVVKGGRIYGDEKKLVLQNTALESEETEVDFSASLKHDWFDEFEGEISLSGTLNDKLANWVKKEELIPPAIFPALPCYAEKVKIIFGKKENAVSGSVFFPDRHSSYYVDFSSKSSNKILDIDKLTVNAPSEKSSLKLRQEFGETGTFKFDFTGGLSESTLDTILGAQHPVKGHITGDLSISAEYGQHLDVKGNLDVDNFLIYQGVKTPILIKNATVDANGTLLNVPKLKLQNQGETAVINGLARFSKGDIELDINLKSDELHYTSGLDSSFNIVLDDQNSDKEKGINSTSYSKRENQTNSIKLYGLNLFGKGKFNFKNFIYNRHLDIVDITTKSPVESYRLTNIFGNGEIDKDGNRFAKVNSASMCGCNMRMMWKEFEDNSTIIITGGNREFIQFDELMPCMNMSDKFIEGPVKLDLKMLRHNGTWSDGWFNMESQNGRLMQMALLSKIFSVINLVDLFSPSGLEELTENGLAFSKLEYRSAIKDDSIVIEKMLLDGAGINIFGAGKIMLNPPEYDMVLWISPLKTIDMILTRVPIFGKALGGEQKSVLTFPVSVKGPVSAPKISSLPADTVEGVIKRIFNTITAPVNIFIPENFNDQGKKK